MAQSLLRHPDGATDMELAELFQESERLWAENERVRRRLDDLLREARRSLGQHPDHQAAAREAETPDERRDRASKQDAAPEAEFGD
jgi:hypothetical protein